MLGTDLENGVDLIVQTAQGYAQHNENRYAIARSFHNCSRRTAAAGLLEEQSKATIYDRRDGERDIQLPSILRLPHSFKVFDSIAASKAAILSCSVFGNGHMRFNPGRAWKI
ncbi:MAG: hypothetical protein IVW54_15805 [Candidatus Binataceae bacterium]|nr:hypothetical protein [Candidatus Binataceae bacterium]